MMRLAENMRRQLRRFAIGTKAAAAVEFALILPLMLTLYLGSVELSSAISVDKRVAVVSGSLGDLVARARNSITPGEIDDFFRAASATMAPYSNAEVEQVVTNVYVDHYGVGHVVWSRGYNGGTKHNVGSNYELKDNFADLARDSEVIVAEAQTRYLPLFGYVFETPFTLYHEYYFLPRFGEGITCDNC